MKKLKTLFLTSVVTFLLTVASASIASACNAFLYQPEVPEE